MNKDKQELEFGKLMAILGKGFSKRSLEQYRKFYLSYNKITQAMPAQSLIQVEMQQALPVTSSRIGQAMPDQSIKFTKRVGGTS